MGDDGNHHVSSSRTKDAVAADAAFVTSDAAGGSSWMAAAAAAGGGENGTAVTELYRSNLLRMECQELVQESMLHLSPHTGESPHEVKWASQARTYVQSVQHLLQEMPGISSTTATAAWTKSSLLVPSSGGGTTDRYWIPMQSMKFARAHDTTTPLVTTFGGGSTLQVEPVGSYGANGMGGLTHTTSNANVLPTLDLAVLLPASYFLPKDYLDHRYFDKRNMFAVHVAKYLSQKKHRKSVGTVHLTHSHFGGDERKISIVMTPPIDDNTNNSNNNNSSDKQKKKKQKKSKAPKQRFRVRLIFGVQEPGWIPTARLLPNRNNAKGSSNATTTTTTTMTDKHRPTPYYNNSLAEDAQCYATHEQVVAAAKEYSKPFGETLALLKVWCLQRGFLRGSDTLVSTTTVALLLTYLYRTKRVTHRMQPVEAATVFFKFIAETNFLGQSSSSSPKPSASASFIVGKDTIRHSQSEGYQSLQQQRTAHHDKHRVALVLPDMNMTEQQTIHQCDQAKLYRSDIENNNDETDVPATLLDCYKQHMEGPILLDPTMTLNYLGRASVPFWREFQAEAQLSLRRIHSHSNDTGTILQASPFRQLFMNPARFYHRYDAYMRIPLRDIVVPDEDAEDPLWGADWHDVGAYESVSRGILRILTMALGDRVTSIRILTTGNGETRNLGGMSLDESSPKIVGEDRSMRDSDNVPYYSIRKNQSNDDGEGFPGHLGTSSERTTKHLVSPLGESSIVIGLKFNPETMQRLVDRGPPADEADATNLFLKLWGKQKAQLRRFKDGAIVHAVLWNQIDESEKDGNYTAFEGDDRIFGGILERIVRHVLKVHFLGEQKSDGAQFKLRNIMSLIDGVSPSEPLDSSQKIYSNSTTAHGMAIKAFESLSNFLRQHSTDSRMIDDGKANNSLGLPLAIDAVDPLSPGLRNSELFPPVPHPLLGGPGASGKRVSGAIVSDPILIQIRFGGSSKWPTDLKAMAAAKTAMLIQLAEGIEGMKRGAISEGFEGPIRVTPGNLDVGYKGYLFRIVVRADAEIKMLRSLRNPSPEALGICALLTKNHIIAAQHHSMINVVHTRHPSASAVVRLATRWIAGHMLSGHIPIEVIELMVAKIYTQTDQSSEENNQGSSSSADIPASVALGFLEFLKLLATHDWLREPLIVDPQGTITFEEYTGIMSRFESMRGAQYQHGPPMYVVSSNDRPHKGDDESEAEKSIRAVGAGGMPVVVNSADTSKAHDWSPTYTTVEAPERVVLLRASMLAQRSHDHMRKCLMSENGGAWEPIFQESAASFKAYSALLRVDKDLLLAEGCSSTGGDSMALSKSNHSNIESPYTQTMVHRQAGPKALSMKLYKNLANSAKDSILYDWKPVESLVSLLRTRYGSLAVFFYNHLQPDVIAMLWRPTTFTTVGFSAMNSELKRPVMDPWESDSLVMTNASDILREIQQLSRDIVVDVKLLDQTQSILMAAPKKKQKKDTPTKKDKNNEKKRKTEHATTTSDTTDSSSDSDAE